MGTIQMDNTVKTTPNTFTIAALCLTVVLTCLPTLSGCATHKGSSPSADSYYLNPQKNLSATGRVTIIELDNNSMYPQISEEITEALFQAIQKKQLFGITILRHNNPQYKELQLDSSAHYTLEQMAQMRRQLNCNAILVGTVNTYQPYPHMSIGLNLRIMDLADGQLLWALEQIWDSTDKTTEQRITNYYNAQMRSGSSALREQLVAVSSLNFAKFVAFEVSQTLEPRQ